MTKKAKAFEYNGKPCKVYRVGETTVTVDSFLAAAFEASLPEGAAMSSTIAGLIAGCDREIEVLGLSRVVQRKITQAVLDPVILSRLGFGDAKTQSDLALTF